MIWVKCENDQETLQSHTTEQPLAPRGRATEPLQSQDIQEKNMIKMIAKLERTLYTK